MRQDLRRWIQETEAAGELRTLRGVHWRVELGAVAHLAGRENPPPALLFDDIPDYPSGYRVLVNALASPQRIARTAGLPAGLPTLEVVRRWKEHFARTAPVPHRAVGGGPVLERRLAGPEIDLLRFPAPLWRSGDGGRYLGTGTLCVTRHPDGGPANIGTARFMVHDARHGFYRVSAGKDSRRHFEAAQRSGNRLPIAICCGQDPSLLIVSGLNIPYGTCEYDVWGGLAGRPLEVIETPIHGLPVPSHAELVLEGEILPDRTAPEGPFGEWSGYYSRAARQEPLVEIQGLYHRESPILLGIATSRPPSELTTFWAVFRSALLWDQLDKCGVGPIRGVWCHPAGGTRLFIVVSLQAAHSGHARQVLMAAASLPAAAYMGRYLVAVDEDIDPTDLESVLWAMGTRSDPARDTDLIRGAWGGPLDPAAADASGLNSRLLIDACRPWGRDPKEMRVAAYSEEEQRRAREIWDRVRKGGAP